jgi:hypothetical protein
VWCARQIDASLFEECAIEMGARGARVYGGGGAAEVEEAECWKAACGLAEFLVGHPTLLHMPGMLSRLSAIAFVPARLGIPGAANREPSEVPGPQHLHGLVCICVFN